MDDARMQSLRVALITDRDVQGRNLRELLEVNGLAVSLHQTICDYDPAATGPGQVDVLLVNLDDHTSHELDRLESLIEHSTVPILFNEGGIRGSDEWCRRLIAKLAGLARYRVEPPVAAVSGAGPCPGGLLRSAGETGAAAPASLRLVEPRSPAPERDHEPAARIWVLGASLGGPQALKVFLSHLPPGLPVGLVIAQHIGKTFVPLLAEQLDRISPLRVLPAAADRPVCAGEAVLVPVDRRFRLTEHGIVRLTDEPMRGAHKPCIDEVLEEVAGCYGERASTIIFSGMGEDGARGAQAVEAGGGTVWAQDAESCVISSMPDAVRKRGCVTFSGTPAELAACLAAEYAVQATAT
ncbi:MAG: chemotaxis protein CheB [Gammaproteobacteria bacterium]